MKIRIIAGFVMAVLALAGLVLVTTYVGAADARALDDQEPREVYLVTDIGGDERGAAAVEFALVVPVLLALLLGIVEFGRAYNVQISVTHAARETARHMAIHHKWGDAVTQGISAAPAVALDESNFVLSPGSCDDLPDAEVVVSYPLETLTGIANGLTLRGEAAMRCGG